MTDPHGQPSPDTTARAPNSMVWTAVCGVALLGVLAMHPRDGRRAAERADGGRRDGEVPRRERNTPAERIGGGDEGGNGRRARTPFEIPAKGWKAIALRVFHKFSSDRVLLVAAGVTFYAILALFPAIGALVSVYGLLADPGTINAQLANLQGVLPGGALDIIGEQVKRIVAKGGGTLGLTAAFGILVSLWSANGGVKAIFDALNIVYGEAEKRNFFWLNLRSLAFTAGALLFVIVALIAIVVVPAVLAFLGLGATAAYIALLRWPLMLLVVLGSLAILYRYGPSRDPAKWRWVTWGSTVAALLWVVVSGLFSWYVSSFGNYNQTYGSLGAVIGFMTWIWISTTVILLGAEMNAEMEHQTVADTTVGEPNPLGARRAKVADTVAPT